MFSIKASISSGNYYLRFWKLVSATEYWFFRR